MAKTKYDIIHDDLEKLNNKMDVSNNATRTLQVIVTGNTGKGHEQRIENIEKWKASHPVVCPAVVKQSNIMARRAVEVAVMAIVITILLWGLGMVL